MSAKGVSGRPSAVRVPGSDNRYAAPTASLGRCPDHAAFTPASSALTAAWRAASSGLCWRANEIACASVIGCGSSWASATETCSAMVAIAAAHLVRASKCNLFMKPPILLTFVRPAPYGEKPARHLDASSRGVAARSRFAARGSIRRRRLERAWRTARGAAQVLARGFARPSAQGQAMINTATGMHVRSSAFACVLQSRHALTLQREISYSVGLLGHPQSRQP